MNIDEKTRSIFLFVTSLQQTARQNTREKKEGQSISRKSQGEIETQYPIMVMVFKHFIVFCFYLPLLLSVRRGLSVAVPLVTIGRRTSSGLTTTRLTAVIPSRSSCAISRSRSRIGTVCCRSSLTRTLTTLSALLKWKTKRKVISSDSLEVENLFDHSRNSKRAGSLNSTKL